jgi:hypothetical protein
MNNVFISRGMCSIPTESKNSTIEGGGEDREVTVPGSLKARDVTHLNLIAKTTAIEA